MWAFVLLTLAGAGTWVFSAIRVEDWLKLNDPGFGDHLFPRPLPTRLATFGPIRRYSDIRAERGESMLLVSTYFGGLTMAACGLFGLLLFLALR